MKLCFLILYHKFTCLGNGLCAIFRVIAMKFYRLFSLFLVLALLLSVFATAAEETDIPSETAETQELNVYPFELDFEIKAKAAMLIELNSNTLVYEYQKDLPLYPASLTKIMTCMLAIEYGKASDVVTVSHAALQGLSEYGSTAGLIEGEKLTLDELLYCVMVSSANEACNVVAEYISGDIDSFVDLMNETAQSLGMTSTHFANTHGLHDENHYTTAYDLSILARWAWQSEQFRKYATVTTHVVPATDKSGERTLKSTNLLTDPDSDYYYDRASGLKTGFTTPAGGCLISTAASDNLEFLSIVCGCATQSETTGDERFSETARLFRSAFDSVSYHLVLSGTIMADMADVLYADGRETVVIHAAEDRYAFLPTDADKSDIECVVTYDNGLPLEAPLAEGERVGTVTAYYQGKAIASCDAVTLTAVERSTVKYVASETGEAISSATTWTVKSIGSATSWIITYWYLTVPLLLVLILLICLIILRCINSRRAKKRAEMRRRNNERRRRNG